MRSSILNQLTVEDIKEIHSAMESVDSEGDFYGMDFVKSETEPVFFDNDPEEYCRRVLGYLKQVKDYRPLCKDRYPQLVEAAEYVTNSTFVPTSRTASNAFIKCMIAHRLHEERYSYSEIGRTIGLSHATVIYYVNKMNDMMSLPKMFESEISEYEAFKSNL